MSKGQSNEGRRRPWPPLVIVGILLGVVVAAVVLPLLPFVFIMGERERRRVLRQLRAEGRVIDWERAKERTQAGEGLLLVEVQKGLGRAWLVANELLAQSPSCPLPGVEDLKGREWFQQISAPATLEWCKTHLEPVASKVMFVKMKRGTLRREIPLLPVGSVRAVLYSRVRYFLPQKNSDT